MELIQAFDDNFDFDKDKNYSLALEVGTNKLNYVLLDKAEKKFIGLKSFNFNSIPENEVPDILKKTIADELILSHNFDEVILQYQSFRAMLVPDSLFDSNNLRAFLKFHHDVDEKDHIYFQELKPAEAFVIFTIPVFLEEIVRVKFSSVKFSHHSQSFINNALEYNDKAETVPTMHIHFSNDFFDVLIVKNNKIQLFNSFFYKKNTDVIYFVSNLLNLFSLMPENTRIYISGDINPGSELKHELWKIFKIINFESFTPGFNYGHKFSNLAQHKFTNLLNVFNCGL
jgi:hypothetical protein